jgi:hypothetical protein
MIRKKTAMATARTSGKRELEFFASTGILRKEAVKEVGDWERESFTAYQEGRLARPTYQNIRLLRDYVEANCK